MPGPLEPVIGSPARRPRHRMVAATLAATALLAGCGIAGGTASLGPTTTQVAVQAHLMIQPAEGPVYTVFTLSADAMTPGAAVQFEITFPGEGRAYPGNALVVADDGTASATYRATTANQPGVYTVRLTGPQGLLAAGEFRVTDGKPLVSTIPPRSSTSATKGTTAKGGTTTTGRTSSTGAATTAKATTTTRATIATTLPPTTVGQPPTTSGAGKT